MSVHTKDPDVNRCTCWATANAAKDGLATARWGYWPRQNPKVKMPVAPSTTGIGVLNGLNMTIAKRLMAPTSFLGSHRYRQKEEGR